MKQIVLLLTITCISSIRMNVNAFEKDVFQTSKGPMTITCIGHGTLMLEFDGKVVHIDPVGRYADYTTLPKADLILVTHEHGDHLDVNTINLLKKETTQVILTEICSSKYASGKVMKNGELANWEGILIEAVPAYNIVHQRSEGQVYHPKGQGNGYILHPGNKKVYIAGDTENTPEMKALKDIDIAFLPMNLPYTMTPEMVADAAKSFKPRVLYPYHFGNTDTNGLLKLLQSEKDIEVRIRKLN